MPFATLPAFVKKFALTYMSAPLGFRVDRLGQLVEDLLPPFGARRLELRHQLLLAEVEGALARGPEDQQLLRADRRSTHRANQSGVVPDLLREVLHLGEEAVGLRLPHSAGAGFPALDSFDEVPAHESSDRHAFGLRALGEAQPNGVVDEHASADELARPGR